ncbi:serine/threonine-protein kinase Nek8-like [Diachasmimorpha longicaudata]|uniref:serine/threonine-protein kinase Nek8-like n=1 Tax=Diachasmimorpha longicaudata TaxID=58733 RepID=UPI0030B91C41
MESHKYVYKKKLGAGAFGCVYLVKRKPDNSLYVIKEQSGQGSQQIVRNEVEQLRKMNHPNIIQYYGCSYDSGKWCIVMQYATGGTLRDFLQRRGRPLSEASALYFFAQIIMGVHHIHEKMVVHRDLKPENIFLHGPHGNFIKIGDFGIAKDIKKEIALTNIGTRLYMAPEVLKGLPYDSKCDIWSAGIILYEMLTNVFPFSTSDYLKMMYQISRGILKVLPEDTITPATVKINYSMLRRHPESRPRAGDLVRTRSVFTSIKSFYRHLSAEDQARLFKFGD